MDQRGQVVTAASLSLIKPTFIMSDQSREVERIKSRLIHCVPGTLTVTLHTMGESMPMATTSNYLALDLGAESGRGLLGRFDGRHLALEEAHRFPNGPVQMLDTLYWDLPRLFEEIKTALGKGALRSGGLDGVGIDTWGVDLG